MIASINPPLIVHPSNSPPPHQTPIKTSLLNHLKQTHGQLIKLGLAGDNYVAGDLVKRYANPEFDTFDLALKVFAQVPHPHVFLWNSLIRGFLDNGTAVVDAIAAYRQMLVRCSIPNKYTFPMLLKACSASRAIDEGGQLHAHIIKLGLSRDGHIASAGIQMYSVFGMVVEARQLLAGTDPVCWNAMINGYMRNGDLHDARELFDSMPCKNTGSWNAMISGYARHGMIEKSRGLFDEMTERDEVSWSAMIDGYVQCGRSIEALRIFRRMLKEGIAPKKFVFSTVLAACGNVGALEQGRWIHTYMDRNSMKLDAVLGTSLVDMYAKCGRLDLALEVFENIPDKEVFSWNAMIGGFAIHGQARRAINLFLRMQKEEFEPNAITFISVLNACAHGGLVEEGKMYFDAMNQEGVRPMVEHYGCMVDLLGRAGLFAEAKELISSMPMKPNAAVWGALLGACRIHGNAELGEEVGKLLLELEPGNSGRYALLSNIYAKAGRWDEVLKVRKLMKERGVKTIPGSSLIELDGKVHEFVVGDCQHPNADKIKKMLHEMLERIKPVGYTPNTSEVLLDIDEEEKESALCCHSEKLAIAFGLHHFREGSCSCMDFW